jgi:hypothetical protein
MTATTIASSGKEVYCHNYNFTTIGHTAQACPDYNIAVMLITAILLTLPNYRLGPLQDKLWDHFLHLAGRLYGREAHSVAITSN